MNWVIDELDIFEKCFGDVFYIMEKFKEEFCVIVFFWKYNILEDCGYVSFLEVSCIFYDLGIIGVDGNIIFGDGYIVVDYKNVVNKGFKWYEDCIKIVFVNFDFIDFN